MPNDLTTPHRFRESAFRRYEPAIRNSVLLYPEINTINPGGDLPGSIVTCTARLRDAITSLVENNWLTTVDIDKLRSIHKNLIIANRDSTLLTGSKEKIKDWDKARVIKPRVEQTTPPSLVKITLSPDFRDALIEVNMLIVLRNQNAFNGNLEVFINSQLLTDHLDILTDHLDILDIPYIEFDGKITILQ